MQFRKLFMVSVLIAGLPLAGNWKADAANSKINFSVHGPFGTVHGNFSGLQATIQFNEKDLAGSSINASVDAKTVSTGVSLRNSDLRNKEEWLNTDKYPRITFRSKKIEKSGNGYKASGELTIKGVTKPAGKEASGLFKGQFTIKRADFQLGKKGGSVGEEITIVISVPVKK